MAKTHYRKAFNSPYLSAADVVRPIVVTIDRVKLEQDATKQTKESFNTAHFVEKELRPGEPLKPMVLNAGNSKMLATLAGTPYIDDWQGITVGIWVDKNVKFGRETVEGLRLTDPKNIPETINAEQLDELQAMITAADIDQAKFCQAYQISELGELNQQQYKKAIQQVKRRMPKDGGE